jgi:hypothetical protein
VIDESDLQDEKHFDPRISICRPISIADDLENFESICDEEHQLENHFR